MQNFTAKDKKKKVRINPSGSPLWHFDGKNSVPVDVFGSYTGTPLMPERIADREDLNPVQDVDDL